MTPAQIREARLQCNSNWELLQMVIDTGVEYPDAVWKVTKALGLPKDEVAEMERDYDEVC
jgi:hypothetical protein